MIEAALAEAKGRVSGPSGAAAKLGLPRSTLESRDPFAPFEQKPFQDLGRGWISVPYVMVHGAWHGAWCWYKVVPLLQSAGHIVIAPDLASLGRDRTPLCQVSLSTWVDHICGVVEATASEPVVLVGHSRGGIIISEVAERRPEKIALLVYLAAFLVRDGESLLPVAQSDGTSLVLPNLVVSGRD